MTKGVAIIVGSIPLVLITACSSSQISDGFKRARPVQQVTAAQQPPTTTSSSGMRDSPNRTWNSMNIRLPSDPGPNQRWINLFLIDSNNPDTIYAAGKGLFRSTDAGESWTPINHWSAIIPGGTIQNQDIKALAINPRNSSELYMSTSGGLFKSIDGGNVWALVDTGPPTWYPSSSRSSSGNTMNVLIIDSDDPTILYAGIERGIIKSMNGGASWTKLMDGWSITTMIVDPQDRNVMYAGSPNGALFKTSNKGKTWDRMQIPNFIGISSLAIDSRDHNTVYAASSAGTVYKTIDGGQQWSSTGYPQFVLTHTLVSDPLYPNTIYAGTLQGLLKSEDGGASWRPDNTGLAIQPISQVAVLAVAIDPRPSKSMYAAAVTGTFKRLHSRIQ